MAEEIISVKGNILNALTRFYGNLQNTVVDNCTSTDTNRPLSAAQGKGLQDQINSLTSKTIRISDVNGTNISDGVSFGSGDVTLKLPSVLEAEAFRGDRAFLPELYLNNIKLSTINQSMSYSGVERQKDGTIQTMFYDSTGVPGGLPPLMLDASAFSALKTSALKVTDVIDASHIYTSDGHITKLTADELYANTGAFNNNVTASDFVTNTGVSLNSLNTNINVTCTGKELLRCTDGTTLADLIVRLVSEGCYYGTVTVVNYPELPVPNWVYVVKWSFTFDYYVLVEIYRALRPDKQWNWLNIDTKQWSSQQWTSRPWFNQSTDDLYLLGSINGLVNGKSVPLSDTIQNYKSLYFVLKIADDTNCERIPVQLLSSYVSLTMREANMMLNVIVDIRDGKLTINNVLCDNSSPWQSIASVSVYGCLYL